MLTMFMMLDAPDVHAFMDSKKFTMHFGKDKTIHEV
jgi:hypothetical protein